MAEAIFNVLAEERGLAIRAESAGVRALVDEPLTPKARTALEEIGVYAGVRRARQVNRAMVEEANLTLAMSARHVAHLRGVFSDPPPRAVHVLPQYASGSLDQQGIPDPYGGTMTAFRATVRQIFGCVDLLASRLEDKEGLPSRGSHRPGWIPQACSHRQLPRLSAPIPNQ
jgi:protein-tyrosine phosphatase